MNQWEAFWDDESQHDWWERPAPEVLQLIAGLSPAAHPRALDLGCGLGRHAIALVQAGFQVTATDASATAIAHLDAWATRLGLSIRTRVGEVLTDTWPADAFDLVLAYNVIMAGAG